MESVKAKRNAETYVAGLPDADDMTKYLIDEGDGKLVMPDIEFTYPSGHKRIGFYLDENLKSNLDDSLMKSVAAKWDGVFVVTGMEGAGKTTLTSAVLKYLDPTFPGKPLGDGTTRRTCERIVFSPDEFITAIDNAQPGQAIQCDEAVLEFLAGDAATAMQKMLIKKMVTIRKKRLYIAFVIPSIFNFKKDMAVRRTVFLLHAYSPDRIQRGSFKFYNYDNKRMLFMKGKKDDNQSAAPPNFIGAFTDVEGLFYDVNEYDKKKNKAIESLTMAKTKKSSTSMADYKLKGQRDLLLYYIYTILEGGPDGEVQLQNLIDYHNHMKTNENRKMVMTTAKYEIWLKETFGEHLTLTDTTLKTYLKNAIEYTGMPADPLFKLREEIRRELNNEKRQEETEEDSSAEES